MDFVSNVRNNIRLLNEQAFWGAPLTAGNMPLCLIDSSKNAVKKYWHSRAENRRLVARLST